VDPSAAFQTRTVSEDSRASSPGPQPAFAAGEQVAEGLVVSGQLGRGASGEVLAVHDLALDREVAMKVLRGAGGTTIARFMREARITARLDHPNVPPVYALDFLPDGGLIFTMRKLAGLSLGESLRRHLAGEAQPAISTVNAVVTLALRVCDALSRAHALRIVHRDVKPDNIMLGPDGEVALVDWGECRLLSEPDTGPAGSTIGTPAYMSPEQARGEPADQRSDIYAVGATFWHVLSGRFPTWSDDPAAFWARKRRGELDELPAPAAARVPRRLLAILRRALTADPAGRYASVRELAADIERFQAGQAVAAYHESTVERCLRWMQRNRGLLAAAAAVLLVALIGAGLLWRERQRQVGDWGEPVLVEDFAGEGWRERWQAWPESSFAIADGAAVSAGKAHSFLVLRRPLSGAVAIEYDGWFAPGAQPGDLSVVWHEDPELASHPECLSTWNLPRPRGVWLQAASFANNFCSLHEWPSGIRLDKSPLRLDPAQRHRFRVELDGRLLRMWVDGRLTLQHEALLPISTGCLGLYAYYTGKSFANIKVYQKSLPEVAPVTLAADVLLTRRHYSEAQEEYAKVVASHAHSPLAGEALYRQGLAAWLDGRREEAESVWNELPPGEQAARVEAHRLDRLFEADRLGEACAKLTELYARAPAVAGQLRLQWSGWARTVLDKQWSASRRRDAEALVAACLASFREAGGTAYECASLLNRLDRHAETERIYPDELAPTVDALLRLGRGREALARFPNAHWINMQALHELGDFDGIIAHPRGSSFDRVLAACRSGRAQEWLERDENSGLKMLYLGRPVEALDDPTIPGGLRMVALWQLGLTDEAIRLAEQRNDRERIDVLRLLAGRVPETLNEHPEPKLHGWMLADAAARGDAALVALMRQRLAEAWPDWWRWHIRLIIEPVVAARSGDRALLRSRLAEFRAGPREAGGQRAWFLAGYVLGQLDAAAMRRQPCTAEAELWLAVGDALHAELAGEPSATLWRRYRDLPPHQRAMRNQMPDPGLERLAQWLSGPPAPAPVR